jgi:hypothetical protein
MEIIHLWLAAEPGQANGQIERRIRHLQSFPSPTSSCYLSLQ